MKILITGAGGQLGKELQDVAAGIPGVECIAPTRSDADITDAAQVEALFHKSKPQYCINAAAYTAVDKAETEKEAAFLVNGTAAGLLAAAAAKHGTSFIHVSTDYVFDGEGTEPYTEDHPTAPLNTYGASKLEGERLVQLHHKEAIILRTSWVYSRYGNNFVKTMLRLMPERPTLNVVGDQLGCPTYAKDLAVAIFGIINSGKWEPGIFQFANKGVTSWHGLATAIRNHCHFPCNVVSIPTEQYPTPAARPRYSVLSVDKLERAYGITIRNWQDCLEECLRLLACKA